MNAGDLIDTGWLRRLTLSAALLLLLGIAAWYLWPVGTPLELREEFVRLVTQCLQRCALQHVQAASAACAFSTSCAIDTGLTM